MKVHVYPSDKSGTGRYRAMLPAQAAKAAGCDVWLSSGEQGDGLPIERIVQAGQTYVRPRPIDADVLVLQRTVDETTVAILPQIMKAGIAVVIDIDDDLSCLPASHPAHRQLNPGLRRDMNWRYLEQACRLVDLVTVSTPALAERYGRHGRVMVLENCVPEKLLDLEHTGDGSTVGWSGWTISHPGDLRATGGGVPDALRRVPGSHYLQIGPPWDVRDQLALDTEPEATGGIPDIDEYYRALTRLDVGICPLQDTKFNAAKSWLKPLEMTACGAAVVMSPRAEYARLHAQGIGVLAEDRGRSWRREIVGLLQDADARAELVERGCEVIEDHWTYERNGHRWAEAWAMALENRRGPRAQAVAA